MKLGASLLADILITSCKLMSVSKDLFFDLFIFKEENACSQIYVDPNSLKNLAAKFFKSGSETDLNLKFILYNYTLMKDEKDDKSDIGSVGP